MRGVIHMRTEHLAPDDLLVAAKVEFDPELSMAELALAIDGVEVAMRRAVPIARLAFIEPDVLASVLTTSRARRTLAAND